jgi:hypothetical protein
MHTHGTGQPVACPAPRDCIPWRHSPATLRTKNLSVHHSGSLGSFETRMKWKNSRLRGFHMSTA